MVLLNQITLERRGDVIDRGVVKACIEMLLELRENNGVDPIYVADFETLFIETSREFYRVESEDFVRKFDPPEYMRKVKIRQFYGGLMVLMCILTYYASSIMGYLWKTCVFTIFDFLLCLFGLQVENRLEEEQLRCSHYLTEKTEPKIRLIVEQDMIAKHLRTVIEMENWGLKQLLINSRLEGLFFSLAWSTHSTVALDQSWDVLLKKKLFN